MIPALAAWFLLVPTLASARTAAPAEAETSAIKGPIKLTLSVYRTKVKLQKIRVFTGRDFAGLERDFGDNLPNDSRIYEKYDIYKNGFINEPVWFRITIQNVGKRTGPFPGPLFNAELDFAEWLEKDARFKGGFLSVMDPAGKLVTPPEPLRGMLGTPCPSNYAPPETPDEIADRKERGELIKAWKKAGLTIDQMNERLDKLTPKQWKARDDRKWERHYKKRLKPGETVSTPTWRYSTCHVPRDDVHPPEGFAELHDYKLDKPGTYRIRAIYDGRDINIDGKVQPDKPGDPFPAWGVKLQTPEIKIEVQP